MLIILFSLILSCSAILQPAAFSFLVAGDWGGQRGYPYTTQSELNVAQGMSQVYSNISAEFVLGVGDNFYSDGVKNVNDTRFITTFQQVFTSKLLPIPFYMIAGNHDHRGNVEAEMDYTKVDPSGRWKYLDYFYRLDFDFAAEQVSTIKYQYQDQKISSGNVKVGILMIDTIILAGQWDKHESQPLGSNSILKNQQLDWIDQQLKEMKDQVDWLLVVGHYPIYSVGEHGPTKYLVDNLLPILHKHRVTFYMNGHDHSLQLIKNDHMLFVTTGAGHEVSSDESHLHDIPVDSLKFHFPSGKQGRWDRGGFVSIQFWNSLIGQINYHNQNGSVIYQSGVRNRNKFPYI